ncbi:MAG: radical SAM protein [Fusobacterium sp.]
MFKKRMKSHYSLDNNKIDYIKKSVNEIDFLKLLEVEVEDFPRAIYVHTPYCDKICSFCNLNRKKLDDSLGDYARYIASEFEKYGKTKYFKDRPFEVLYFGGGTPTVYNLEELETIFKSIRKNVVFSDNYEFTFESTLHNLNRKKLELMMEYGVNRISIGIQTFSDEGRKFYNRTFTKKQSIKRLKEIKEYFKGDICIDIIYNYPGQKEVDIVEDAKIIKEIGISSSSFYSLMIHEGSCLSRDIQEKKVKINNDLKTEKKLHDLFLEELCKDREYYPLELTKIAKKNGDDYQYIKVRNKGGDTFPIGVGAGGNVGEIGVFRMNKEKIFFSYRNGLYRRYSILSGIMQFPIIKLNDVKKLLDEKEYRYFIEKVSEYKKNGLIKITKETVELTNNGIFWGNNISKEVINHIIDSVF